MPEFNIPIARPTLSGNEAELIQQALTSGWVSMGPLTQQFEKAICEYTHAKHAVAMNSCTSAIHVAMLVHDIGAGHDVLCPSYSFIATANGIRHAGAEPQFVDIDPATLNIDVTTARNFIEENYKSGKNKKTGNTLRGILIVHQIGIPADLDAFIALAKEFNIVLMEDNACGLGSTYKGQPLGASGLCNTLSFHPRKVITSGEGGMLLTNDDILADRARVFRAHGMSISDLARHNATSTTFESYNIVGYNYRLTDMQSAVGLKQMESLPQFIDRRVEIATQYNAAFSKIKGLSVISPPAYVTRWNYQSYPLRLENAPQKTRDAFMQALQDAGIATRRGIPPIHKEPVYERGLTLPNTEAVSQSSLFLPIFPGMTDAEVKHVIVSVQKTAEKLLGVLAG